MLPWCGMDVAWCFFAFAKMLHRCCMDVAYVQLGCCIGAANMLQRCGRDVSHRCGIGVA